MNNVAGWDRFLRALGGVLAMLLAVFWLGGVWSKVAGVIGGVLLLTAALRFCPIYVLLGLPPPVAPGQRPGVLRTGLAIAVLVAVAVGGVWGSQFLGRKIFLADFNAMNAFYKQALFFTGKGERAPALENYDRLLPAYAGFRLKYQRWQPIALRGDDQLTADLDRVDSILQDVGDLVRTGDLQRAHLGLEAVRPVFQELFKRNGFSMLSVALVDFHDAMERMLEAGNAKDGARVAALYPDVDGKLKAVEVEANDADIQAIRHHLDALLKAAQNGPSDAMPGLAGQLKSSFVKVYLQRG